MGAQQGKEAAGGRPGGGGALPPGPPLPGGQPPLAGRMGERQSSRIKGLRPPKQRLGGNIFTEHSGEYSLSLSWKIFWTSLIHKWPVCTVAILWFWVWAAQSQMVTKPTTQKHFVYESREDETRVFLSYSWHSLPISIYFMSTTKINLNTFGPRKLKLKTASRKDFVNVLLIWSWWCWLTPTVVVFALCSCNNYYRWFEFKTSSIRTRLRTHSLKLNIIWIQLCHFFKRFNLCSHDIFSALLRLWCECTECWGGPGPTP